MHRSSYLKAKAFVDTYLRPAAHQPLSVLEIGSKCYESQDTCRSLFGGMDVNYLGLDVEPGPGVDLVPAHPFVWRELQDEAFDACLCVQVFEHNPFFWITFAEIARVLKQGGLALVIAPGRGPVHRYPADCWRFFPDAWSSLCAYTGLELKETFFEDSDDRRGDPSLMWADSCAIVRKPKFANTNDGDHFHRRLSGIVATAPDTFPEAGPNTEIGPALSGYLSDQQAQKRQGDRGLFRVLSHPLDVLRGWRSGARGR